MRLKLICVLCICILLTSCKYELPEEKRPEVISNIAAVVDDNYSSDSSETPLMISMADVEKLSDNSELNKAIEKYHDVQQYKVYLLEDNKMLIVTDALFQGIKGYVVSDEELEGVLEVPGMGFDSDRVSILNRIEGSNIYRFSAGQ